MRRFRLSLFIFALLVTGGTAYAIEPIPEEPGWSGNVIAGASMLSAETNMVSGIKTYHVKIGEKTVDSLSDKPDTVTKGLPMVNLNLNYTFSTQSQVFLGNQLENIVELDKTSVLGVRQQFDDKSILELALVTTPYVAPLRVWEDPYVVGQARTETNRTSRGLRMEYDRILGSGFGVQLTARKIDIDTERSGTTQLGLPPDQAKLLKRSGNINRLSVSYRLPINRQNQFQIRVGRLKDDLDGEAMSGDQNEIQLTHGYFGERFVTVGNIFYWKESFDKSNPVFNKTRDDSTLGLAFMLFDKKIFNSKNWWGMAQAVWVNQNSNIDFYDASSTVLSLGAMYRF
jgi:Protein of unknown function (DUF2860)